MASFRPLGAHSGCPADAGCGAARREAVGLGPGSVQAVSSTPFLDVVRRKRPGPSRWKGSRTKG